MQSSVVIGSMPRLPESPREVDPEDVAAEASPRRAPPRRWAVSDLCGAGGEAILVHNGEDYRLRVTSRGRLILTK